MRVNLKPWHELSVEEDQAIAALAEAVYPPETQRQDPGRRFAWAQADWVILITDPHGRLVSLAGLLVRPAQLDTKPVRIGGISNVKTHPEARRKGYAAAAVREALRFLADCGGTDFALLFCAAHNVPFYRQRGWQSFRGDVLVAQPSGPTRFTAYEVLCQDLERPAPMRGTIDLCGMPW